MVDDSVLANVFEMLISRLSGVEASMADMRAVMQMQDDMLPVHSRVVGALHDAPNFTSVSKNYQDSLPGGVIYAVVDYCMGQSLASAAIACDCLPPCSCSCSCSPIPRLTGVSLEAELLRNGFDQNGLGLVLQYGTGHRVTCEDVGLPLDSCNHHYLDDEMTERELRHRFPQLIAVGDDGRGMIFSLGQFGHGRGRKHTLRDVLGFLTSMDPAGRWSEVDVYSLGHEGPHSDLTQLVSAYVCDSPGEYHMLDKAWRSMTGPTQACVLSQLRYHHLSHIGELLDSSAQDHDAEEEAVVPELGPGNDIV